MRLRLAHQFALLQLATVAVVLAAMAAVIAWNLRRGFDDFLRERDAQQLERFADLAGTRIAQAGLGALQASPAAWRELVDAVQGADGEGPGPGPETGGPPPFDEAPGGPPAPGHRAPDGSTAPPPEPPDARPPDAHPAEGRPPRPPGPPLHRPPGRDPNAFGARWWLATADGTPIAGHVPPRSTAASPALDDTADALSRPVRAGGRVVAIAHLRARPAPPWGLEARFLERQLNGIAAAAALAITAVLALSTWAARRWVRPLLEARGAARRIAEGAFDVRLARRGDDEIGDLAEDINRMASALQALEKSRRRWIAELSHELRTPLAVLRAELECLRDGIRPLDAAAVASLDAEVGRLARLTEDFHTLAMSDLHAWPMHFAPVDVPALLRGVVERFRARAEAAGLALTLDLPAELSAHGPAVWDGDRIEQLLATLLDNSLRHTDAPGRIEVAVQARPADRVEIVVSDSAPGVPPQAHARLFDPLFRADPSRSRASGGSGLGLAIARAIAQAHGADLQARPGPLGGLALHLELPWRAGTAAPQGTPQP